jgi:CheY-like chemotaxis protein
MLKDEEPEIVVAMAKARLLQRWVVMNAEQRERLVTYSMTMRERIAYTGGDWAAQERTGQARETRALEVSRETIVSKGPVLVVDDDADMLAMIDLVLGAEGYKVVTAANGAEALKRIAEEQPSLILLDMRMPVMDGWRFAEEFRARYKRRAPIVVMTAAENAKARAEEIQAEGSLAKPFDLDELFACVRHFVPPPNEE